MAENVTQVQLFETKNDLGLDAQIHEVERELNMRRRLYPQWVSAKRMKDTTAKYQIEVMKAVLESLHRLKGLEK